jgi:PKD repeat protein
VALSVVTVGDIHPGDVVEFSASMTPHEMTMPFSYSIDMGDGSALIVGSSSDDPMVFTHTFALADAYTVTLSISNCGMTEPVARSVNVVVTEPMHYLYLPVIAKDATP